MMYPSTPTLRTPGKSIHPLCLKITQQAATAQRSLSLRAGMITGDSKGALTPLGFCVISPSIAIKLSQHREHAACLSLHHTILQG